PSIRRRTGSTDEQLSAGYPRGREAARGGLDATGARDLSGLDAGGADPHAPRVAAAGGDANRLDVGVPAAVGLLLRPRHVVAEARPLATDVAHASHGSLLKSQTIR